METSPKADPPRTPRLKNRRRSMEFPRAPRMTREPPSGPGHPAPATEDEVSDWSDCCTLSAPSSWSPAASRASRASRPARRRRSRPRGGVAAPRPKRRSISELSPSARMTPENLKMRGLGLPWDAERVSLCRTEVSSDQEKGRQLCLIATPELHRSPAGPAGPAAPRAEELQKSFTRRVREASLCLSPDSDDDLLHSPLFSPTRRLKDLCDEARSSERCDSTERRSAAGG